MYMDAQKLMNQKNYIMKHKQITKVEVEEIRRELQREGEKSPRRRRRKTARTLGYPKGW